jgi:hypothetical protein
MRARAAALLVGAFVIGACAGRPRTGDRDRNLIRADEIATVAEASTAYDVVSRLRPEFLRTRGPRSAAAGKLTEQPTITVFLDGVESGPVERTLYLIPATEVFEIRLYRAADAVTKYGTRHTGGVIAVTTKRAEKP